LHSKNTGAIVSVQKHIFLKYARLTKEQFEELHPEFINFLATQSITGEEWATIKAEKPKVAEEELDIFSDLVWEGVLQKAEFLENSAPQQLFLFKIEATEMQLISLKVLKEGIDITTVNGYQWLQDNFAEDSVEFFTASKEFSANKSADIFGIIRQGAHITKGDLYRFFDGIVKQ
jgi:cag pathogenicity island protein 24